MGNMMFRYSILLGLLLMVGCDSVADTSILRTDNNRGPWMDTVDDFARISVNLPADYVECFSFTTSIIEMPIYLAWLSKKFEELGGLFHKYTVDTFSELPKGFEMTSDVGEVSVKTNGDITIEL